MIVKAPAVQSKCLFPKFPSYKWSLKVEIIEKEMTEAVWVQVWVQLVYDWR